MKLPIADCGLRIARRVVIAALLPAIVIAQTHPSGMQETASTAATAHPSGPNVPVTFGRSGRKVAIAIPPINLPTMKLALRAYGRVWATAIAEDQNDVFLATFETPPVRTPTVFSVTHAELQNPELAQVVAYPDRDVEWDKKIMLYSCGAPAWFDQWSAAIGLPLKQITPSELSVAKLTAAKEEGKSLLILGRATAAEEFSELRKQVKANPRPVLVLDAEWLGQSAGPVSVAPAQMRGVLAEMAKQQWAQSLKFNSHCRPWDGIANRWAWIVDESGLPLVEQIRGFGWREVCSYLSWPDVLGRSEQADELLLTILKDAASLEALSPRKIRPSQTALADAARFEPVEVNMLYPPRKDVSPADRPVLSSALPSAVFSVSEPSILFVLDLRSKVQLPADVLDRCRDIESRHNPDGERKLRIEETDPDPWRGLLILGDDKMLDEWQWLKLDRAKKTINRPGVIWLSDDELPPSKDNQIRLMLKLTELDVPLSPPTKEEKKQ